MTEEISVRALTPDSANLTMNKEYLVINGKHYQATNSYLYRSNQPQVIKVKNILSMEYLTLRSKRFLMAFIILMTIVVFGAPGVRKLFSVTRQIDQQVQKVENVYNYFAEEKVDINLTDSVKHIFLSVGIKGLIAIYFVLIIGSSGCLFAYFFKPYRVLYISSMGNTLAVKQKFYDSSQLDAIVNTWKMQLRE